MKIETKYNTSEKIFFIEDYKIELLKEIKTLMEESKSKRDTINDECINPYFARLDTLEEIIKLIAK